MELKSGDVVVIDDKVSLDAFNDVLNSKSAVKYIGKIMLLDDVIGETVYGPNGEFINEENIRYVYYDGGMIDYDEFKEKEESECLVSNKKKDTSLNNGGATGYYDIKDGWKNCQDIIEDRNMNYSQGNIMKCAFTFNLGRHDGTDYERDLNKIIWFAQRELERIGSNGK